MVGTSHQAQPGNKEWWPLWNSFKQQRLRAWQPLLTPKWVISIYIISGLTFVGLGIALLLTSWSVVEMVHDYTDADASTGYFDMHIEKDMEPPIWMYYQLESFHQNHRRYVKSRDDTQMRDAGTIRTLESEVPGCQPWVVTGTRVNYPCGLIARSIFNDTFDVMYREPGTNPDWKLLELNSSASRIAWADDLASFKNVDPEGRAAGSQKQNQVALNMWILEQFPPVRCEQQVVNDANPWAPVRVATRTVQLDETDPDTGAQLTGQVADCRNYMSNPECNFVRNNSAFDCSGPNFKKVRVLDWGVRSGHFLVWMRIAGLPTFRKLWGRLDKPLKAGTTLRVYFEYNFPVHDFEGRKAVVFSTSTAIGGRNDFLGIGYVTVGTCCLIFGAVFLWRHLTNPRPLGDVSLLACQ